MLSHRTRLGALMLALLANGCSSGQSSEAPSGSAAAGGALSSSGGASQSGAADRGGSAPGGSANAGVTSGGSPSAGTTSGGSAPGGSASAGTANGGTSNGGTANAGSPSGGSPNGGTSSGGAPSGGSATGGTSSGGADAGTAGAAGNDDPCATALYCDDFEGYPTGQAPGGLFQTQLNSGAISVVDSEHASGTKSVMFTTEANSSTKTAFLRLEDESIFPVAENAFYGRMMFRLEAAPTDSVHWTFIQAGGTIAGESYHALYRYGGQLPVSMNGNFAGSQMMANYETPDSYSGQGPSSDCWQHADQHVVPVGTWTCAEWMFDGPNNELRLWIDGVAQDDLTVMGVGEGCVNQPDDYAWTAPNFEHVEVGWESYQADEARTLYVDDLVISTQPIGCPQ